VSSDVPLLAVTVLGDDRPGIVADVARALAGIGGNLEDSTMTLLRGHFAMVVLVRTDHPVAELESVLAPLAASGDLAVDVRPIPEHGAHEQPGATYTLRVHGADRPGIVAAMTSVVVAHGGNIIDLGTRLGDGMYVLVAEIVLPPSAGIDALEEELAAVAREIGVDFHVSAVDDDVL
jgi:glycine cleavage system transcriptional repressor